mmetsp:Transcript_63357/g.174294  ORF Transcript_63357/g.174294 Transcript_63357/m.174294 type:complete len:198 (+) Transcript_63357:120-713(+)
MDTMKVVVVGDGAVGKTCLLLSYTANQYPQDYVPTIFDTYSVNTCVDDKLITLSLWDTAGQEDYDKLRPLSYPLTDCFILCFSVLNPESLQNAKSKWLPELEKHSPGTPVVLVGTKIDAREDPNQVSRLRTVNQVPVSTEAGSRVAEEMGLRYMECSAMTQMGLKDVFDTTMRTTIAAKKARKLALRRNRRKMCTIC